MRDDVIRADIEDARDIRSIDRLAEQRRELLQGYEQLVAARSYGNLEDAAYGFHAHLAGRQRFIAQSYGDAGDRGVAGNPHFVVWDEITHANVAASLRRKYEDRVQSKASGQVEHTLIGKRGAVDDYRTGVAPA
jgi:hypothetical protein